MSVQPEALRLAEVSAYLEGGERGQWIVAAAAELRRLHAENASLAAALASSCDEQRHELWESGGVAGCERARVAEQQRDALLEALKELTPPMPPADAPCHVGLVPQEKCAHCGRIARARAAIKAVQEGN